LSRTWDEAEIRRELFDSYEQLAQFLGKSLLPIFAYPWGAYHDGVLRLMSDSPYRYAVTTHADQWDWRCHPHLAPRFNLRFADGNPARLQLKLLYKGIAKLTRSGLRPRCTSNI